MGKTRDLFKKIRDTKGIFHAKMGIINDRNGMDLTEAEDIKKRWQEVEVRNRFKGLDLTDRVPHEVWMEVHDIVQETGIKTIPMEKKCKKAKCLSGEALQIAVKRREAESKGEKERYKRLNAEFQRTARRDQKAFLSNQCKEIGENNRMGKTRDLFK